MSLSLSSLRAVSMMMGTSENSRIFMHASLPDSPGIITSMTIRSRSPFFASSTAAAPS